MLASARAHALPLSAGVAVVLLGVTVSRAVLLGLLPIAGYFAWALTSGRERVEADVRAPAARRSRRADELRQRADTEPLPAAVGAGADGHLLMQWPAWADAIWGEYGPALLEREDDVAEWAAAAGYPAPERTCPTLLADMTNLHALFADQRNTPTVAYPRNRVTVPVTKSGKHTVQVADYNRYTRHTVHGAPDPKMLRSTIAVSPFPPGHPLIITPRTASPGSMWTQVAGPRTPFGDEEFDATFDVYTREPDWVAEVLTPELTAWLLSLGKVRVLADRGSVVVATLDGWAPIDRMFNVAISAAYLARAARKALA